MYNYRDFIFVVYYFEIRILYIYMLVVSSNSDTPCHQRPSVVYILVGGTPRINSDPL